MDIMPYYPEDELPVTEYRLRQAEAVAHSDAEKLASAVQKRDAAGGIARVARNFHVALRRAMAWQSAGEAENIAGRYELEHYDREHTDS